MTYAVSCHECDELAYPPHEAEGSAGRSEIAALRLALEHAREEGHTEIHIIPGCYYVGDGARPEGFGHGIDVDDCVTPERGKLVDDLQSAVRTLNRAAEHLEDAETPTQAEIQQDHQADHLRRWADLLERKQRERGDSDHDV